MNTFSSILLLGKDGMVGRTVDRYLRQQGYTVFSTSRNIDKHDTFWFDLSENKRKLTEIISACGTPVLIINTLGILRDVSKYSDPDYCNKLKEVNSDFPVYLSEVVQQMGAKVLHISTDAVFADLAGVVDELSASETTDRYGQSKLFGEQQSAGWLNVRTSFVGPNPNKKLGLWETVKNNKTTNGYVNQEWSGCTTLQFAQFVEWCAFDDNFEKLRSKTSTLHFSPLSGVNKSELMIAIAQLLHAPNPNKVLSPTTISRNLHSMYEQLLPQHLQSKQDLTKSLEELLQFEQTKA